MTKKAVVAMAALIILLPAAALAHTFSLRLGAFFPQAPANLSSYPDSLWAIEFDRMNLERSDFRGSLLGGSFDFSVNRYFSLSFTLDSYSKGRSGYYEKWISCVEGNPNIAYSRALYPDQCDVEHTFSVSIRPIQLSAKFSPLGRNGPFAGGGIGYYRWSVDIQGSWIDFENPVGSDVYPILQVDDHESGYAWGFHILGGVRIPLGHRVSIEGEGRYHWAKAKLENYLDDFHIGGLSLTVGIVFSF